MCAPSPLVEVARALSLAPEGFRVLVEDEFNLSY